MSNPLGVLLLGIGSLGVEFTFAGGGLCATNEPADYALWFMEGGSERLPLSSAASPPSRTTYLVLHGHADPVTKSHLDVAGATLRALCTVRIISLSPVGEQSQRGRLCGSPISF